MGLMSIGSYAQTLQEKPATNLIDGAYAHGIPGIYTVGDEFYFEVLYDAEPTKCYLYDSNLSLMKSYTEKEDEKLLPFNYVDCKSSFRSHDFCFTQNLFNNDDAFEYAKLDKHKTNGYYTYSTYMSVMSETGKELIRITFDKPIITPTYVTLIHLGSKDYIMLNRSYYDSTADYGLGEDFTKVYLIDRYGNGQDAIREVETPEALKAIPSLARKNQSVSIELGDNAGSHLLVTSANGSVVRQLPIKQGQKSVQLSTRGLSSGVYVVSTTGANGTREHCKIVIK